MALKKKIEIGEKGKIWVVWNVTPNNYSHEEEKNIKVNFAKKYNVPEKNVKVEPHFIMAGDGSDIVSLNGDTAKDIQDPKFQLELFKKWLTENKITDYDFDAITNIDNQINALINYNSYEKCKRYSIKWIKWSNFLSYGDDNYFDFTTLKGLVLLNGDPANKSGKSTFAYDLIHFLLFGRTKSGKAKTLDQLFNNYLPDTNEVKVEGCISFDGEDYIIKRALTRPDKSKKNRTASQKVEYYRVLADGVNEELTDTDNLQEASSTKTSKVIKEAIGNEDDFDLIISANAKDLDDLISLKDTDRGRLLSRWIGLSVLEDKDAKAREKWNKEISVGRYCDIYNRETLKNDIEKLELQNFENEATIAKNNAIINESEKKIIGFKETRDTLLSSKKQIDSNLFKIDVATLTRKIQNIIETGKNKKAEMDAIQEKLKTYGEVSVDESAYKALMAEKEAIVEHIAILKGQIRTIEHENNDLASGEYCPTCKRKFENVDNSKLIAENKDKINKLTEDGISSAKRKEEIITLMTTMEKDRELNKEKNKMEIKYSALQAEVISQRNEYKEAKALMDSLKQNQDAIAENNKIDASINIIDENIKVEEKIKLNSSEIISYANSNIKTNETTIAEKKSQIVKIEEEIKIEKNWKLYLQMIGKDGICKMVLRNTLPIINGELSRLLNDVSDFDVEVTINEKNDVDFWLVRDDIRSRLTGASGLERTQAALALRVVLGNMSRLSKPPFILLDEVLGGVAKENYDDMKKLYDKIAANYDFILHITHLDLQDWHDQTVTVVKKDNISSIKKQNS